MLGALPKVCIILVDLGKKEHCKNWLKIISKEYPPEKPAL